MGTWDRIKVVVRQRLGPPGHVLTVLLVAILTAGYGHWLQARLDERLTNGASEIQRTIEEYADDHGRFPSFNTFDTTNDLKFRRAPINPYTERRMRLFRSDQQGRVLGGTHGLAGHLGYYVSPDGDHYRLFLYGQGNQIIGYLDGSR